MDNARRPVAPPWVRALRMWLAHDQYALLNRLHAPDWLYWPQDMLEQLGLRALCRAYGHAPVRDVCGRPEHDHCLHCRKTMPHRGAP